MVPQRLLTFQPELGALTPETESTTYTPETWERYFHDDPDYLEIHRRYPEALTRGNLQILSTEAISDPRKIRTLFLGSMMWAYGTIGQGPFRTYYMLTDPAAAEILQKTILNIGWGQIIPAYDEFRIRRCGPAYFTKFFYFTGLGSGPDPMPLMLDPRIARSLRLLTDDLGLDFETLVKGTTSIAHYPEGYLQYIRLLNGWSYELGCRPDAIEYFLSKAPPAFRQWRGPTAHADLSPESAPSDLS